MLASVLDRLAAWLGRLLGGDTPEPALVPVPVERPRRRR